MEGNQKTNNKKTNSKAENIVIFFFVWMGILTLTFGFFKLIGFIPETPKNVTEDTTATASTTPQNSNTTPIVEINTSVERYPELIIFDTLNRQVPILNPQDTSISTLDNALLSGVVRYPESADFQKTGTIFLLGHSSYLPVVHNKNFQAFNGVQDLKWGDTIRLRSADTEYVYTVDRVYEAKASDALVPIEYGTAKLTLATCNSLGTKDDRFIVEATLISQRAL